MKLRGRALSVLLFMVAAGALGLRAQIVETGTITGVVRDNSGAVIAEAQVSIKNTATGITSTTMTDSQGLYVSLPLDPGDYTVELQAPGFGKVQEHLRLEVGHALTLTQS